MLCPERPSTHQPIFPAGLFRDNFRLGYVASLGAPHGGRSYYHRQTDQDANSDAYYRLYPIQICLPNVITTLNGTPNA